MVSLATIQSGLSKGRKNPMMSTIVIVDPVLIIKRRRKTIHLVNLHNINKIKLKLFMDSHFAHLIFSLYSLKLVLYFSQLSLLFLYLAAPRSLLVAFLKFLGSAFHQDLVFLRLYLMGHASRKAPSNASSSLFTEFSMSSWVGFAEIRVCARVPSFPSTSSENLVQSVFSGFLKALVSGVSRLISKWILLWSE